MKYRFICLLTLFCLSQNIIAEDIKLNNIEKYAPWALPSLKVNKHPVCQSLLKDAQDLFKTEASFQNHYFPQHQNEILGVAEMKSVHYPSDQDVTLVDNEGKELEFIPEGVRPVPSIKINGITKYLRTFTHPGCGGACETYQLLVSDTPQPENDDELSVISHPPAPQNRYQLYKNSDKTFWILQADKQDNLHVFSLLKTGEWKKSCQIQFEPNEQKLNNLPGIKEAKAALKRLVKSVEGLTRGAGNCGTMRTHQRWAVRFSNALSKVLYKPWDLDETYSEYASDITDLNAWALTGLLEYEEFNNYSEELKETIKVLSRFYQTNFGWDEKHAEDVANTSLTTVIGLKVRFWMYSPFKSSSERTIRKAILEKQPIEHIRSLEIDLKGWDRNGEESILALAVNYPEALQYLLERGLNPNHANAFGKTPLMYAAQYNQYESAKLLISAGANTNTKTIKPLDSCYYTIQTFDMTPLHYAVRYSSKKFIKLLIDNGAQPSIEADNHRGNSVKKESPLVWLKRYTQNDFEEKNLNITANDIEKVETWLKSNINVNQPNPASKKAKEYIIKAEKLYRQNKILEAYDLMGSVLEIEPENVRALSGMSLFALKTDNIGQSIFLSNELIDNSSQNGVKANAWFNIGLACEKHLTAHQGLPLKYYGEVYCTYGYVYPFYKALKTKPTKARMNKLIEIFNSREKNYCEFPGRDIKINFQYGKVRETRGYDKLQSFFVYHKSSESISGEDLSWSRYMNGKEQQIIPGKIDSINLGDHTLTVFEISTHSVWFPYKAFGYQCTNRKSIAQSISN